MLNFKQKRQVIVLILIILTVAFIFIQSALPISVSNKESEAFGDAVGGAISGVGTPSEEKKTDLLDFIKKNVRKMAHFAEYAILGAEIFVLVLFAYGKKGKPRFRLPFGLKALLSSLLPALIVSFFDESVQILSKRGYSVTDMWIDIFGYLTSFVILYIVFFFIGKKRLKP
jgi:VanZ family protein